jgi:hypothetical protein
MAETFHRAEVHLDAFVIGMTCVTLFLEHMVAKLIATIFRRPSIPFSHWKNGDDSDGKFQRRQSSYFGHYQLVSVQQSHP